jgi:hypothetical protein
MSPWASPLKRTQYAFKNLLQLKHGLGGNVDFAVVSVRHRRAVFRSIEAAEDQQASTGSVDETVLNRLEIERLRASTCTKTASAIF